ncbi:hypothetical protein DL96DRAFT_1711751 [Flagelloscypha sp. PMI_526]|nr:hypothetical protein DL96DRAFT_1711751 [Flagelloscypha sp. PMI_526]
MHTSLALHLGLPRLAPLIIVPQYTLRLLLVVLRDQASLQPLTSPLQGLHMHMLILMNLLHLLMEVHARILAGREEILVFILCRHRTLVRVISLTVNMSVSKAVLVTGQNTPLLENMVTTEGLILLLVLLRPESTIPNVTLRNVLDMYLFLAGLAVTSVHLVRLLHHLLMVLRDSMADTTLCVLIANLMNATKLTLPTVRVQYNSGSRLRIKFLHL